MMYLLTGNLSVAAAASVARPERITEVAKLEAAILKGHPNGARCKSHVLMCPPSSCGFILGFITEYFIPTFQQLETSCFFGGMVSDAVVEKNATLSDKWWEDDGPKVGSIAG